MARGNGKYWILAAPLIWPDNRRELTLEVERLLQPDHEHGRAPGQEGPDGRALLLVSLDAYPRITYNLGQAQADLVLDEVQRTLTEFVGDNGLVLRSGRDEFAVLLRRADANEARRVALGIQGRARGVECGLTRPLLSVSVGVRTAEAGEGAEEVLVTAAVALEAAKAGGRGKLKLFEPFMLDALEVRHRLSSDLAEAVREGALTVAYQPIVSLKTGRVQGVEALARWAHPALGPIRPDEFLPLAEELGIAGELDHHVLTTALAQTRTWLRDLPLEPDFSVSVNITASQLQHLEYIDGVRHALSEAGVPAGALVLEITEASFVAGDDVDTYSLLGLRRLGVGLDIDDFGTGYSSISYLRRLPVSRAKIDRSLLGDVAEDPAQRRFLGAVLRLVEACGLSVVMEGIETAEQALAVAELGADAGQGYYFSRPLPAEQMTAFLKAAREQPLAPFSEGPERSARR